MWVLTTLVWRLGACLVMKPVPEHLSPRFRGRRLFRINSLSECWLAQQRIWPFQIIVCMKKEAPGT